MKYARRLIALLFLHEMKIDQIQYCCLKKNFKSQDPRKNNHLASESLLTVGHERSIMKELTASTDFQNWWSEKIVT